MRFAISVVFTVACALAADLAPVVSTQIDRTVQLPGEIQPFQAVALHAKITGFVEEIPVDVGSIVKKGDLLARLVAPELTAQRLEAEAKVQAIESQRAEAEARVAAAASTYDRLKTASATPGVITGNELVQAEKAVEAAKAQVRAAEGSANAARAMVASIKEMETYLRVVAPFDGVITERKVHPGALVGPGGTQPAMLLLEQNSRLRVIVFVPEVEVSGIARGARVTFTVPAFPGERFGGTIARIPRTLDAKTRSMPVELDVSNTGGRLAPGMYPTVAWPVRRARPALVVPPTAVVTTTERSFVVRSNGGVAEWVDVTKGPMIGDGVEVFGNLKAGDQVLKRASDEIRPGTRL